MEIVASAAEANLFQWLFGGFIFVVIRKVHFYSYSEGSFSERVYYHCPIEVQFGRLNFNRSKSVDIPTQAYSQLLSLLFASLLSKGF